MNKTSYEKEGLNSLNELFEKLIVCSEKQDKEGTLRIVSSLNDEEKDYLYTWATEQGKLDKVAGIVIKAEMDKKAFDINCRFKKALCEALVQNGYCLEGDPDVYNSDSFPFTDNKYINGEVIFDTRKVQLKARDAENRKYEKTIDYSSVGDLIESINHFRKDIEETFNKPEVVEEVVKEEPFDILNDKNFLKEIGADWVTNLIKKKASFFDISKYVGPDYKCSYIGEFDKDGSPYLGWIIENENGSRIQDRSVVENIANNLRETFPGKNIYVTSRQYRYAPELVDFMIMVEDAGKREFSKLKPGVKFYINDDPDRIYEVEELYNEYVWTCSSTNEDGSIDENINISMDDLEPGITVTYTPEETKEETTEDDKSASIEGNLEKKADEEPSVPQETIQKYKEQGFVEKGTPEYDEFYNAGFTLKQSARPGATNVYYVMEIERQLDEQVDEQAQRDIDLLYKLRDKEITREDGDLYNKTINELLDSDTVHAAFLLYYKFITKKDGDLYNKAINIAINEDPFHVLYDQIVTREDGELFDRVVNEVIKKGEGEELVPNNIITQEEYDRLISPK